MGRLAQLIVGPPLGSDKWGVQRLVIMGRAVANGSGTCIG